MFRAVSKEFNKPSKQLAASLKILKNGARLFGLCMRLALAVLAFRRAGFLAFDCPLHTLGPCAMFIMGLAAIGSLCRRRAAARAVSLCNDAFFF